ncbi:putative hydrolase [Okibacterium sp. HSC-33S16]|uniref:PHP domain-containing protein n=1 Tax=Okibacterium sp. HSC-33S16 TaxID=2910965 RepID=UPI00209D71F7|nr:PHP domain-containing protein [Okibacterium sp. HSC-33S16]MCP2030512.1 putative hydrolase [Okibacterium sp. HSC-33S16]
MSQNAASILAGDHHVHSTFSDDATSTLAENVAAAVEHGVARLRLVDHVRQSTTWVPDFLRAVAELDVPDGLTVLTGVEAKILNASGSLDIPPGLSFGDGGIDTVLIADHQFPGTDGPWSPREARERLDQGLDVGYALDLLIGALVGAMESVPSAQLAHCFSILPKIGLSEGDFTDDQLRTWARAAARTGTLLEVNEKWACPGPRALRAAVDAGVTLVASTDSHAAGDIGRYARVNHLLAEAGVE